MNVSVIGIGYVGLVSGTCFAELGLNVMCMDNDHDKINKLKSGIIPIYEPGLQEIVEKNFSTNLHFTNNIEEAVDFADVIFIAVNTPALDNGSADLHYVFQVAENIASCMKSYKVIVNKSTVPVGTGQQVKKAVMSILHEQGKNIDFDVVSNPEFLREGSAVKDFINPDRIVIGAESTKALDLMNKVYSAQILQGVPYVTSNIETAEMIKYASNAFLAAKISYINEIAHMCELCNADVKIVAKAMGLDTRIGSSFLSPGPGYGGSCFPKDTRAFLDIGRAMGYVSKIVKSAIDVNFLQKKRAVRKIRKAAGKLRGKTISILGISFKPETDDIRESPALFIISELLNSGAKVRVFDPKAMDNLKKYYPEFSVQYSEDLYSACELSDCIVLVTDWLEFGNLNFIRLKSIVRKPVFIDLRNMYDPSYVKKFGFYYEGTGRK